MDHFDWPFTKKNKISNALNASKLEAFTTNERVYLGYIGVFLDDAFKISMTREGGNSVQI